LADSCGEFLSDWHGTGKGRGRERLTAAVKTARLAAGYSPFLSTGATLLPAAWDRSEHSHASQPAQVPRFGPTLYRERNRVATPYEKRGVNYLAMATLAAVTMWL
jgi:hypothetical protein